MKYYIFTIWILNASFILNYYLTGGLSISNRRNSHLLSSTLSIPVRKEGECPSPTTLFGSCIFNSTINCLNDGSCKGEMKCCREGCNKICKIPVEESNEFIWEWFDLQADQVSKIMEASEDWIKESFDSLWEVLADT